MNRQEFDAFDRLCEQYTGRSWDGTLVHASEALGRQSEAVEVLSAHADWLSALRARVEATGEDWNTVSCRRYSRLAGDLSTPPEWLAEQFERDSPDHLVNRQSDGGC